jgi:hypothetical protein
LDDAGIVGIGLDATLGMLGVSVANHIKERVRAWLSVDDPLGVKNFVAAVLGIDH